MREIMASFPGAVLVEMILITMHTLRPSILAQCQSCCSIDVAVVVYLKLPGDGHCADGRDDDDAAALFYRKHKRSWRN